MLEQAVSSITSQLDRRTNQIVIVDDASADASICESVARRHGVELMRTDEEIGGVATHNVCYQSARAELIHILHGDDWVLPGFYDEVRGAALARPGAALYATFCLVAGPDGRTVAAPRPHWLRGGSEFQPLHEGNPLCVAACVVSRDFVAKHGGWDARLYHVADWLFWHKATTLGGACSIDRHLAVWRTHPLNHSSRLARTGANLRNFLLLPDVIEEYAPGWVGPGGRELLRKHVAEGARRQEDVFRRAGDLPAAAANAQLARELEV